MKLCLLLLSLLLWSHSEAEVVQSVSDCPNFFLNKNPPRLPGVLEDGHIQDRTRYKPICQTYDDQRRFFTLYDTTNKIPVFSAYIFKGNVENKTARTNWMIEPQLETNMETLSNKTKKNQATDDDYKNNRSYDRGHLHPSSYGYNKMDQFSTFTLTNIVPQKKSFNNGRWNKMEQCVKCVMEKYCIDNNNRIKGYLVTGAEPGNEEPLKNKINIPSMMWSAFCCFSSRENKWLASAHWADNVDDKLQGDKFIETKTLNQFYRNTSITLFSGSQCPLHETVTRFYPELNAENELCWCPPTLTTTSPPNTTTPAPTTQNYTSTTSPSSTTQSPSTTSTTTTTTTSTTSKRTTTPKCLWNPLWQHQTISYKRKLWIYYSVVRCMLRYGWKPWPLNKTLVARIDGFWGHNIRWPQQVSNEVLRACMCQPQLSPLVAQCCTRWFG